MPIHLPRMPAAPSLDDLRDAAPGVTLDDAVHVTTIAALHLVAVGWQRTDDGHWIDSGEPVTMAVAIDLHLRMVAGRGGLVK